MSQNLNVHPTPPPHLPPSPQHTQTHFTLLSHLSSSSFSFLLMHKGAHARTHCMHVRYTLLCPLVLRNTKSTCSRECLLNIHTNSYTCVPMWAFPGRGSCMADTVLLCWSLHCFLCLYLLLSSPSLSVCLSVYLLVSQQTNTAVILQTIFIRSSHSLCRTSLSSHKSPAASSEPILVLWRRDEHNDCVCICVSIPLVTPALFPTERVPALCVSWLAGPKERRLFCTYPETLPCQAWDEILSIALTPHSQAPHSKTHTITSPGGRVIPCQKSSRYTEVCFTRCKNMFFFLFASQLFLFKKCSHL